MNVHVTPDSGIGELCPKATANMSAVDPAELHKQAFRILQALELIEELTQNEIAKENTTAIPNYSYERFLNNVQFLSSTSADVASRLLSDLPEIDAEHSDKEALDEQNGSYLSDNDMLVL